MIELWTTQSVFHVNYFLGLNPPELWLMVGGQSWGDDAV